MPDLEPITREEKLLDGEDLTPITRKEQFIKRIYDKTQEIPEPITREEMFLKKAGEGGGGDIDLQTLNVTENGTVNAPSGVAYDKVVTDVPQPTMTKLTATENRTYTAPSGTAYNEVDVDVPLPENAYLLKELSNLPQPIASFSDGADAVMQSLKVDIEPVQDLHGYDHPWAGGAGKNKLNPTVRSDHYYYNSSGTPTYQSAWGIYLAKVEGLSTVTISGINYTDSGTYFVWLSSDAPNSVISVIGNHKNYTNLEVPSDAKYIGMSFLTSSSESRYDLNTAQVESGSSATSYAPYSNICPISGWTEEVITRTGKNLATESSGNNKVVGSVRKGCTYTFSVHNTGTIGFNLKKNSNSGYVVASSGSASSDETISVTFTADDNYNLFVNGYGSGGATYGDNASNYQLEIGTTATEYEPYAGTTTTIPFTDSQGNPVEVYGGSVDVVNGGEQPSTLGSVDMGDLNWQYSSSSAYFSATIINCIIPTIYSAHKPICEAYKGINPNYINSLQNGEVMYNTTFGAVFIKDSNYTDATAFKNSVAGKKIVYELATPTTFYTQPTSIKSLEGENNVFASTGDVEELEYFSKEAE